MAKVWRSACGWVGEAAQAVEDPADVAGPEPGAAPVHEDRLGGSGHGGPTPGEPLPEGLRRPIVDRHPALLASLAQHGHRAATQVDPAAVEPAELGDPQAGGVEQLEHGPVTLVDRRGARAVEEGPDLPARKDAGQSALARGGPQRCGPGPSRGDPAAPTRRNSTAARPPCGPPWRGPAGVCPARPGSGEGAADRRRPVGARHCGPSTGRRPRGHST